MKTSFQRIYTEDGLELHGLLYEPDEKTNVVLVHVHGMGGNFYENKFLDYIAKELTDAGIAFCAFNNRGCELMKDMYKVAEDNELKIVRVGSAYEKFEDAILDIKSFIDFVESKNYSAVHLSGHSLGCPKVAYYMATAQDRRIKSVSFLSPSDMLGLVRLDKKQFEKEITEAKGLVAEGRGDCLLSEWVWGEYPITAATYISLFADDTEAAIFNFYNPDDTLELLQKITVPVYAVMGTKDGALVVSIEETFSRLEAACISSSKVETEILSEANHGYRGHETEIAKALKTWLKSNTETS